MTSQKTLPAKKKSQSAEFWGRLFRDPKAIFGVVVLTLLILVALFSDVLYNYDVDIVAMNPTDRLQGPSAAHLFGTDEFGRDIFKRVMYGTKMSLAIGVMSVVVAVAGGVTLGAIAGYYGGKVSMLLMRLTDCFSAIPQTLLAIVIVASLGHSVANLFLSIGIATIPRFVRITRAAVLTVKDQEYVEAARAVGARDARIICDHILSNCMSVIIVQATTSIANSILLSAGLSFLGLGIKMPMPEWGAMLSAGRSFLRGDTWYMAFFPGLAIMLTVLAFNLLGDGLRDALDPKLRR